MQSEIEYKINLAYHDLESANDKSQPYPADGYNQGKVLY
jgi:hypothetical protein